MRGPTPVRPSPADGPSRPPDPTELALLRAGRDLVLAGLLAGGVFVAAYLARAVGVLDSRLRMAGLVAALLVAVGWALASRGRLGLAWLGEARQDLTSTVRSAVALAVVWTAALALYAALPGGGREAVPLWTAGAVLVGVAVVRRPELRRLGAAGAISTVLALHVAGFAWSGVEKVEAYPYAPFQMYSVPRLTPYEVTVPRLVATTGEGAEVDLTGQAGGATLRAWLSDPTSERVEATVRDLGAAYAARTGIELVELRVVDETWTVPPHPAPPEAVLDTSEVVLRVDA